MYKEIRTLIKRFIPKLIAIKDAKGETLTENYDILARWKEHCEGSSTKYGSTGASTTDKREPITQPVTYNQLHIQ